MTERERLAKMQEGWMKFAEVSPGVIESFGNMRAAACPEDGALDFKTLELISVAVAVARKCEPCMLSHVQCAVDAGVTREELCAALNCAILLCGGPGWAYSGMALEAFDDMTVNK
ncbi:MAG: carboxymuconolactone decarboxylase family protein [Clostridiales bacterium]|nr:carboxymuconolactone decarboxylase family protein [Clostridiales bacterium]